MSNQKRTQYLNELRQGSQLDQHYVVESAKSTARARKGISLVKPIKPIYEDEKSAIAERDLALKNLKTILLGKAAYEALQMLQIKYPGHRIKVFNDLFGQFKDKVKSQRLSASSFRTLWSDFERDVRIKRGGSSDTNIAYLTEKLLADLNREKESDMLTPVQRERLDAIAKKGASRQDVNALEQVLTRIKNVGPYEGSDQVGDIGRLTSIARQALPYDLHKELLEEKRNLKHDVYQHVGLYEKDRERLENARYEDAIHRGIKNPPELRHVYEDRVVDYENNPSGNNKFVSRKLLGPILSSSNPDQSLINRRIMRLPVELNVHPATMREIDEILDEGEEKVGLKPPRSQVESEEVRIGQKQKPVQVEIPDEEHVGERKEDERESAVEKFWIARDKIDPDNVFGLTVSVKDSIEEINRKIQQFEQYEGPSKSTKELLIEKVQKVYDEAGVPKPSLSTLVSEDENQLAARIEGIHEQEERFRSIPPINSPLSPTTGSLLEDIQVDKPKRTHDSQSLDTQTREFMKDIDRHFHGSSVDELKQELINFNARLDNISRDDSNFNKIRARLDRLQVVIDNAQQIISMTRVKRVKLFQGINSVSPQSLQSQIDALALSSPPSQQQQQLSLAPQEEEEEEQVESETEQGSGLRPHRGARRGSRMTYTNISGAGIQPHSALGQNDKYKKFGRYLIHMPSLMKGFLKICFPSGKCKTDKRLITTDLVDIIVQMLDSGKVPTKTELLTLDPEEVSYFTNMLVNCNLEPKYAHLRSDSERDKDVKRFRILQGEIEAGNDSPEIFAEIKKLIIKFMYNGTMNRRDGDHLLGKFTLISV